MIDYDHSRNSHSIKGAAATLSAAFSHKLPTSLLDVGCGTGTWLHAAAELGILNLFGVDGILVKDDLLRCPKEIVDRVDLTANFDLGRRFDVAICMEVAEHLPESAAGLLISSLVAHSDVILFSAACPGQPGQHHVNCRWPAYWQKIFNNHGYSCDDSIRWQIWEDQRIEPWYRQNMFWARRDPHGAGHERRLKEVIHPEFLELLSQANISEGIGKELGLIAKGSKAWGWYVSVSMSAAFNKLSRKIASDLE
jgi:SAM-dependent methyltransferase